MTARGLNRKTLPDPNEYGRKGDLSLGEDLRKWFLQCIADKHFNGILPPNALVYMGKAEETATAWAADQDWFVSSLGRIVLLIQSPFGSQETAGRLYRDLLQFEAKLRRYVQTQMAANAKSRQSLEMGLEEYRLAEAINRKRAQPLSLRSLAAAVARQVRRRPEAVRARLASIYKKAALLKNQVGPSAVPVGPPNRRKPKV